MVNWLMGWGRVVIGLVIGLMLISLSTLSLTLMVAKGSQAQTLPKVTIAVQEGGTVFWELDTIVFYGLDKQQGYELSIQKMAGEPATRISFAAGESDLVVADWIWVVRSRAEGKDYRFFPYSKAVGGIYLAKNKTMPNGLADLKGKKIAIAGGPIDKSWVMVQALVKKDYGIDLAKESEQVFGAPPLVMKQAVSGDVDAAINFWHFLAKMEAAGLSPLITISEVAQRLHIDAETPLLGYVFHDQAQAFGNGLIAKFRDSSLAAKQKLASDQAAWDRLRPLMNAANDDEFQALISGFRKGIPKEGRAVDPKSAAAMLSLMQTYGGEDLLGKQAANKSAEELVKDVFLNH